MHNKSDIIKKGMELFRTQGYNNTGISDILITCHIPKGSFYNYFQSKEAFCIQALDSYGDSELEYFASILKTPGSSPLERLKNLYHALIERYGKEATFSGCLVANISSEMGGLNESLAEAASRNFSKWIDIIARTVAKGQAIHEIRNDKGALEIAEYLHGTFSGMLARLKASRNPNTLDGWFRMTFAFMEARD